MKHNFKLEFNPAIQSDIQQQVDYYFEKTKSHQLGIRFAKTVKSEVLRLKTTALQYEIKYDNIRCLPIPNFPHIAHYRILEDQKIVKIEAILSAAQNPKDWKAKTNR